MSGNVKRGMEVEASVSKAGEGYVKSKPGGYRGEGEGQLFSFLHRANLA